MVLLSDKEDKISMKKLLSQTSRGDIIVGKIFQDTKTTEMTIEIEVNVRGKEDKEVIPVPEKDLDIAEQELTFRMQKIFLKLHNK